MLGKAKRRQRQAQSWPPAPAAPPTCPLCDRPIPEAQKDAHHLVPKSKGGKATQYLHRICHRQIHSLLSETELARHYNTAQALREHPDIQKFIAWVRTKPDNYLGRVSKSTRLRN